MNYDRDWKHCESLAIKKHQPDPRDIEYKCYHPKNEYAECDKDCCPLMKEEE